MGCRCVRQARLTEKRRRPLRGSTASAFSAAIACSSAVAMATASANARADAAGADEAAGGDAVEHDAVEHEGAVAAGVACAAGGGGQGPPGSLSRSIALDSFWLAQDKIESSRASAEPA